jgi:hypothetical protein
MIRTKKGIVVNVTNTCYGMLVQGGIKDRRVLVRWGAIEGLHPGRKLEDQYNDQYTWEDMVRNCAFGKWGDQTKTRVIRRGHIIL